MRDAKDSGDVVEARLRAVLAGRAAPAAGAVPAAEGGPLSWSDIVPGWAEEELAEERRPFVSPAGAGGSSGSSGGFPAGTAWAGGPVEGEAGPTTDEPAGFPWDASRRPRPPSATPRRPQPASAAPPPGSPASLTEDGYLPSEAFYAPASSSPGSAVTEPSAALSGAGAFGGDRRAWLHAFNPGRAGVRALGAVAVVVVLVAGLLAWRARPRVEPAFDGSQTTSVVSAPRSAGPSPAGGGGEVVVAVGGKVRKPGLVRLASGARVADALTAAGGADPGVDVAVLNLARRVTDGELIMVGVTPPPGLGAGQSPGQASPGAAGPLVNLNTASLAELDGLPGVGPVLAQRILDARDAQGGFRAIGDLRKVDGIGDARYEQLKDLVTV